MAKKETFDWNNFIKTCKRETLEEIVLAMSPHCQDIVEHYTIKNTAKNSPVVLKNLKSQIDNLIDLLHLILEYEEERYDYWNDEECDEYYDFSKELDKLKESLNKVAKKKDFDTILQLALYAFKECEELLDSEYCYPSELIEVIFNYYGIAISNQTFDSPSLLDTFTYLDTEYCYYDRELDDILSKLPQSVQDIYFEKLLDQWRNYPPIDIGEDYATIDRRNIEKRLLKMANNRPDGNLLKVNIWEKNLNNKDYILALYKEYKAQNKLEKIIPLLEKAQLFFTNNKEIREALLNELTSAGNHENALILAWETFKKHPLNKEYFNELLTFAQNNNQEEATIKKVLKLLEENNEKLVKNTFWKDTSYNDRQIEILLQVDKAKEAWKLGLKLDISNEAKLKLANSRLNTNSKEAIALLLQLIEEALIPTGEEAYFNVVNLLSNYQYMLKVTKNNSKFEEYCAWIKQEYKRRRKLIEIMAESGF
jgi:hypothetical protein